MAGKTRLTRLVVGPVRVNGAAMHRLILCPCIAMVAVLGASGCGGQTKPQAAEAAHDLRGQEVPGVGAVKRAQCVDPPLRCVVNSAQRRAAVCDVTKSADGGFSCERPERVEIAEAKKTCTEWENENFEQIDGPSGLEFECAMARKLSKLPPNNPAPERPQRPQ